MTITSIAIIIGLCTGLTEVAKQALNLPTRFAPLTSVVLGILTAALFTGSFALSATYVTGIIAGLSACGLYSGVTATVANNSNVETTQEGATTV